jgi:tRNA(Ile2)-agmatinylcytidine synthase
MIKDLTPPLMVWESRSVDMWIGIDDTDSPEGMCTTYLGAVLARRLSGAGMQIRSLRLIRLNPNVIWKTRGNAAVAIEAEGDPDLAFAIGSDLIDELADLACDQTNPGLVVSAGSRPPSSFAEQAITGFCTIDEAIAACEGVSARYAGWKNGRGLIGATAAIAADLKDSTSEILVYRERASCGMKRSVDPITLRLAEEMTFPHTWDTVDQMNRTIVCVPHTPDPVLFGIRGESPVWVSLARHLIWSEPPELEAIFETNQGTDAHLVGGFIGSLEEGRSYLVSGTVSSPPVTGIGGHVSLLIRDGEYSLTCMAYEPTKGFRDSIRALAPGDRVVVCGSYKDASLNLEKILVLSAEPICYRDAPICPSCGKKMTSAGADKGYKCRLCSMRLRDPVIRRRDRTIVPGWYEVPPSARRHLARPLCRGAPVIPGDVVRDISDPIHVKQQK